MLQLNRGSGVRKAPKQPARRAPKTQGPGEHPAAGPAGHPGSWPGRAGHEETSGPGGRPSSQPRRASRRLAPQGTQETSGPGGHPRSKEAQRPTVPKDSGPGRHPRNKWSWGQAACSPGKLSRLETAPIPKKNCPTPDLFFLLGPRQSADSCGACCKSTPLATSARGAVASCFATRKLARTG